MASVTPRRIGRVAAQLVVAAAALAALAALSDFPIGRQPDHGMVRLSWRMVGSKVNICHEPSAEELAELPSHMRRERVCSNRIIPYRLRASLDGTERFARTVRPAGAHGDRPIFVQEELVLAPGAHRLHVEFVPDAAAARAAVGLQEGPDDEAARQGLREALQQAPRYSLERSVRVEAGRIVLVELEEGEGAGLRVVTGRQGSVGGVVR